MPADESGTVTAESAVILPVLTIFALGLTWVLSLGVTHVRTVDAAREVARVVARGDSAARASALGLRVAPRGSHIAIETSTGTVVVTISAPVRGPAGLFAFLPQFEVHSQAVAATEPTR